MFWTVRIARALGSSQFHLGSSASAFELLTRFTACPRPSRMGGAGDNILSMLEEDEVALKRAELHVVEARGRVSDQSAKIARLKSRGESSLEAEQDLGLFEAYLLIVERHRDFLLRSRKQRPHKR